MSKYALAKELLNSGYEQGKALSLDEADIAEVMITSAIQELIRVKGAAYTKDFLRYETDSVSEKGVFEIHVDSRLR
jgi:hypothetical protein